MSSTLDVPPARQAMPDPFVLEAVVDSAVAGDTTAIGWLLSYVQPLVVRYCQARLGGSQRSAISVDDVAQEVLVALFRALPGYQNQGRPFLAFVYGIAGHKVADARRVAARNGSVPVRDVPERASTDATPEQAALREELAARMEALMRRALSPRQREILILRLVAGLSAEEVAEAMGSTPGAIRVAQHRALARLRRSMGRGAD